jgi:dCMP deaminase
MESHLRPTPDAYYLAIATAVASRATCDRKHVGAILVKDKTILSTGYNGSPRGMKHCDEIGHMMEEGHCVRTTHAEANALVQAAKNGTPVEGSTIYTTASPCWQCMKLIINAGVRKIVFGELYRDERITDFAKEANVELEHFPWPVNAEAWADQPLPEDKAIETCFHEYQSHSYMQIAMRLVGAKRSKFELVKLVNWLLHQTRGVYTRDNQ